MTWLDWLGCAVFVAGGTLIGGGDLEHTTDREMDHPRQSVLGRVGCEAGAAQTDEEQQVAFEVICMMKTGEFLRIRVPVIKVIVAYIVGVVLGAGIGTFSTLAAVEKWGMP